MGDAPAAAAAGGVMEGEAPALSLSVGQVRQEWLCCVCAGGRRETNGRREKVRFPPPGPRAPLPLWCPPVPQCRAFGRWIRCASLFGVGSSTWPWRARSRGTLRSSRLSRSRPPGTRILVVARGSGQYSAGRIDTEATARPGDAVGRRLSPHAWLPAEPPPPSLLAGCERARAVRRTGNC